MIAVLKINLTVYKDQNTPDPFIDQLPTSDDARLNNRLDDHVYLDCMGFGMGMCCLQVCSMKINRLGFTIVCCTGHISGSEH